MSKSYPIMSLSISAYDVHDMFVHRLSTPKFSVRSYAFLMFGGVFGFALVDLSRAATDPQRVVTAMVDTIGLTTDQVEGLIEGIAPGVRELGEKAGFFVKPRRTVTADAKEIAA